MTEVTRGVAYGIGISQIAIVLGVVIYSHPVSVHLYAVHPSANSTTLSVSVTSNVAVHMGPWMLMTSAIVVMFSTTTYNMAKAGIGSNDYVGAVMEEAKMWDAMFWLFVLSEHAFFISIICSPIQWQSLVLSCILIVYFLGRSCVPRCIQASMANDNMNFLGMGAGFLVAATELSKGDGNGAIILGSLACSNYMLQFGHTWDPSPTMDTVINCRLFYVCTGIIVQAVLYESCYWLADFN